MYSRRTCLLAIIALGLMVGTSAGAHVEGKETATRGSLDAYISGKVLNATAGFRVNAKAQDTAMPPNYHNFTTTTDPQGRFLFTVDSDPSVMTPYIVDIKESYYQVPTRGVYGFIDPIVSGGTDVVPDGELELVDAPLGDLKVTVLNGSSMLPLPGANVDISASVPDPPFPTAKVTDAQGSVTYLGVRAANTTIKVTKANFKPLDQTTEDDYSIVAEGVQTNATFVLVENPFPFTTSPANGATDVNHTAPLVVDFKREMDQSSIEDVNSYYLRKGASPAVGITVQAFDNNWKARIVPASPLDYGAEYTLGVTTSVKTKAGAHMLWRTMEVVFEIELPPPVVSGRVVDSENLLPVGGISIELKTSTTRTGVDGRFLFPVVLPGEYKLTVDESYLYFGNDSLSLDLEKGDIVDVGDIKVEPRETGSLIVTVVSGFRPLPGAWVAIQNSDLNLTTDPEGIAYFERTRTGLVTVRAGAPHHSTELDQTQVRAGQTRYLNFTLVEDPTPVTVVPSILSGGRVGVASSFKLVMPYEIEFSTLDCGIWMVDSEHAPISEVAILPVSTGDEANTFIVKPVKPLDMERSYQLVVDSDLTAEGRPDKVLWSDLYYYFRTPDHPLSHINGVVLLEGKPLEGIGVSFGPFSAATDMEGGFALTIDLSDPSMQGNLSVDSEPWGYASADVPRAIAAGETIDAGTMDLLPVPGRYHVEPSDGSVGVDPSASIVFTFSDPIATTSGIGGLLSVVRGEDSTMIPGDIALTDNRTAVLDPTYPLEEGKVYRVIVSDELMLSTGYPACPVGNETSFTVRLPSVTVAVAEPAAGLLMAMPLDQPIVLSFSMAVNRTMVEGSLAVTPTPGSMAFVWKTPDELEVHMFLLPETDYDLDLPSADLGDRGEPMASPFHLDFRTASNYTLPHPMTSFTIFPDPSKELSTGANLTLTGIISNSAGYKVLVRIAGNGIDVTYNTTVRPDGSWQLSFDLPLEEGEYTLRVTIGMPGAPSAIQALSYSLNVASGGDGDGEDDGLLTMAIIGIVLLVICVIVTFAVLRVLSQRRRAQLEIDSREYDEVDMEMEE